MAAQFTWMNARTRATTGEWIARATSLFPYRIRGDQHGRFRRRARSPCDCSSRMFGDSPMSLIFLLRLRAELGVLFFDLAQAIAMRTVRHLSRLSGFRGSRAPRFVHSTAV